MPRHVWDAERAAQIIAAGMAREGPLLPILHALNRAFGHVPQDAVPVVAQALNLSRAEVHGVLTFYQDFREEPAPAHVLKLCRAEACQARGGETLAARLEADLSGVAGLAVEAVYCLGLCASGPSGMIDGRPVARLTEQRAKALVAEACA